MPATPDSERPESNRRDFLSGKSLLGAARGKMSSIADSAAGSIDNVDHFANREANYVEQYSKNAMACEFELLFNLHQYSQSGPAAMLAFQLIDDLEDQMTVYRPESEISQLNKTARNEWVRVEQGLYDLIKRSLQINQDTDHAFDITAGPLSKVWGFDRRSGSLPDKTVILAALACVGMEQIEFDDESGSIRFSSDMVSINLNGIGKGYALDQVASLLVSKSIGDFIIHGGQSSVLARGSSIPNCQPVTDSSTLANPSPTAGWSVGVSHPTLPGVRLGEFSLRDRALGTSGTARQGFFHNGKRYGHIIDPRTGWPAGHVLSTTVVSSSAALSDALATAFFVMPIADVQNYCDAHDDVAAILVEENPKAKGKVELHCFNVSESDWRTLV